MKQKPYNKLTKAEKRIAVAKDVILQLTRKHFIAKKGIYVDIPENIFFGDCWNPKNRNADIKKNFDQLKGCQTCAMGSCILSITKFENHLKFKDIGDASLDFKNKRAKKLLQLFPIKQIWLIENAFEGYNDYWDEDSDRIARDVFKYKPVITEAFSISVNKFYDAYSDSQSRLIAIMKNIIRNKGTFVLPEYKKKKNGNKY